MALSFLKGRKTAPLTKTTGTKKGNPLDIAKGKVLEAIGVQKGYAQLTIDGKPIPKAEGKTRSTSTWFYQNMDGWWTTLRYGQLPIPLNEKNDFAIFVGEKADDLVPFYDAVIAAVQKGEMDAPIRTLQEARSKSLTGRTRKAK